ncbi:MAG: hypothetical protein CMP68_00825 [Flavobacteriales bacterium]|nr:hypothetical protein [Flavobacteriales bacterium]|tara:strand:+ start:21686 stop:22615 length:930 start_codon:yes stop_codon:yes gene_type:complete
MKTYNLFFFLLFLSCFAYAQQLPLNSQYIYNPLVINPSFAGISESSSIVLMNRNQWAGFVDDQILTTSVSAHHALNNQKHGVGALLFSDRTGAINIHGLDLMYSFKFPVFLDYNFSLGISANLYQYLFDDSDFNTAMYDPLISGQVHKKINFDSNFGFLFYDDFLFLGGSVVNLVQSKVLDNELTQPNQFARNFYFFGGYSFSDTESKIDFEQSFLLKKTQFTDFQYDINLKTIFSDIFWLGAGYRSNKEVVGLFGFNYDRFSIIYSIDYNYGDIGNYSGASHEFSLVYYFRNGSNINWQKNRILFERF